MRKVLFFGLIICFFSSCGSLITQVVPERIEKDILTVSISEFETRHPKEDGFLKLTVNIKNNSNQDIEFSAQSFFEDKNGRYQMIYLPPTLYSGSSRDVSVRKTSYRGEGSVSFGFTGNFWGISGFELDTGSHWRIDNSDLKARDIYMTLVFKIGNDIFKNTYHLKNY